MPVTVKWWCSLYFVKYIYKKSCFCSNTTWNYHRFPWPSKHKKWHFAILSKINVMGIIAKTNSILHKISKKDVGFRTSSNYRQQLSLIIYSNHSISAGCIKRCNNSTLALQINANFHWILQNDHSKSDKNILEQFLDLNNIGKDTLFVIPRWT